MTNPPPPPSGASPADVPPARPDTYPPAGPQGYGPPPGYPGYPPGPPPKPPAKRYNVFGQQLTGKTLVVLGCLALLLVCGGIGAIGDATTKKTVVASASTQAPAVPPSAAAPTAAPTTGPPTTAGPPTTPAPSWPNVPLTKEAAEARLRSERLEPTAVTMFGAVVIARYKPNLWDENTAIQRAGTEGLKTARALSNHPDVAGVRTEIATDFTDQYGKTEEEIAVWSLVNRATMAKIDWDGLAQRVGADGSDWLCIADDKGTHPGVWKKLETRRCLKLGGV